MRRHLKSPILVFAAVHFFAGLLISSPVTAQVLSPGLSALLDRSAPEDPIPILITLSEQVDVGSFRGGDARLRRIELVRALKRKAALSQRSLADFFMRRNLHRIRPFWIFNGFAVTAPASLIRQLAGRTEIFSIRLDESIPEPAAETLGGALPEWNLGMIRAPELWAMGHRGAGVVVASMDTGVDVFHADLGSKWRGGGNSWFDPNGEHAAPFDASGHGTQVMSLMVGGHATGTSIGVAPDARWIAVKIFDDSGLAELSDIHAGFEWLLDPDGDPETDDAPHLVNNSWGFYRAVDRCYDEFELDIRALKSAGMLVVFSAGNEGPLSHTSVSPANYSEVLAVGAVDASGAIAAMSSRGPSACDADSAYPVLVAPGVGVKTARLTYGAFPRASTHASGTSMAAPQVTGGAALLLGAFPSAASSSIEGALLRSARDIGIPGIDIDSGHGLIDLVGAYGILVLLETPACTDADGDGFFAETGCGGPVDCDDGDPDIYPGAPEIKSDGIDQDCNGWDLTIRIIRSEYRPADDSLVVEAASALGKGAMLGLADYGEMAWNGKQKKWELTAGCIGGNPGIVTVSGIEGSETVPTTVVPPRSLKKLVYFNPRLRPLLEAFLKIIFF
jgi:bacillopeptidase F